LIGGTEIEYYEAAMKEQGIQRENDFVHSMLLESRGNNHCNTTVEAKD